MENYKSNNDKLIKVLVCILESEIRKKGVFQNITKFKKFCFVIVVTGLSEVPSVPHSLIPPAALIPSLHLFLSLWFSHIQICSFPILHD